MYTKEERKNLELKRLKGFINGMVYSVDSVNLHLSLNYIHEYIDKLEERIKYLEDILSDEYEESEE